jgi:hypothetical protein
MSVLQNRGHRLQSHASFGRLSRVIMITRVMGNMLAMWPQRERRRRKMARARAMEVQPGKKVMEVTSQRFWRGVGGRRRNKKRRRAGQRASQKMS